jgi:hypothetical protein
MLLVYKFHKELPASGGVRIFGRRGAADIFRLGDVGDGAPEASARAIRRGESHGAASRPLGGCAFIGGVPAHATTLYPVDAYSQGAELRWQQW